MRRIERGAAVAVGDGVPSYGGSNRACVVGDGVAAADRRDFVEGNAPVGPCQ